jgi:hypothetical protein
MKLALRKFAVFACSLAVATAGLNAADAGKKASKADAPKKARKEPGAEIFDNKTVLPLSLEISPSELQALQRNNRHHVRATLREGTNVWKDVGVHLKGAAGSFRGIDDKPALTVSFGKFTPDQKFHGLKKIHLNNSVQDGSYMCENICGELFRKSGVPAARVTYATLEINGRKKGFYVVKEGFEKQMLGLYFKKTSGNLYDGGFLREITDPLERDNDSDEDVKDWSDLKALAAAAQEPDPGRRWEALNKVLDVDRFASFMAIEVMAWDWDGYVMNRNNYRVFHDLGTDKMVFIPHGMDQMFWQADGPVMANMNGLVAQQFIRTPQGRRLYRERFSQLFTNVFQIEVLTNRVAELSTLVRASLTNLYGANAGRDYDGQSKRIHDLIVQRHASLIRQLGQPQPGPIAFNNGVAKPGGWEIPQNIVEQGHAKRDKAQVDGRNTLRIQTGAETSASWRTRLLLEGGKYRFEASAKCAGVVPVRESRKGDGAGIRISGSQAARQNQLVGDSPWQTISYEFEAAAPDEEVTLVCELRATKGEVWFDVDSFKLVKLK